MHSLDAPRRSIVLAAHFSCVWLSFSLSFSSFVHVTYLPSALPRSLPLDHLHLVIFPLDVCLILVAHLLMCSLSAVVSGALDGAAGLRAGGARLAGACEQVAPATRDGPCDEESRRSRASTSRGARESERERERHLLDRLERAALHPAATRLSRAPLASRQRQPAALVTLTAAYAERLLALSLTPPERLRSPPRAASTRSTRRHSVDQHRHCHRLHSFPLCALLPARPTFAAAALPPVARISPREGTSRTSLCSTCVSL